MGGSTEQMRVLRRKLRDQGLCTVCRKPSEPYRCDECAGKYNEQVFRLNTQYKQRALEAYGNQCQCCGETEVSFLQFHHMNGRDETNRRVSGARFFRQLARDNYPNDIELLCANCHAGKHANNGVCPHQIRED